MTGSASLASTLALLLALAVAGCGKGPGDPAPAAKADSNPRAPGAMPTHELSFRLLADQEVTRFERIRRLFADQGEPCARVLSARLEGGTSGMDQWRVTCADSGKWDVWLNPEGHVLSPTG